MLFRRKKVEEKPVLEKPLLIGLDHEDIGVSIRGGKIVEKFGQAGKAFFVEGSPIGLQHYDRPSSFDTAIEMARQRGMRIVPLDRLLIGKIKKRITEPDGSIDLERAGLTELEFRYLMSNVREKAWVKVIQKHCQPGDIVIMHPNHLAHIMPELQRVRFAFFTRFVSPPTAKRFGPLSKTEIRKMKQIQKQKRPLKYRKR